MKKSKILSLVLAVSLSISLAACSSNSPSDSGKSNSSSTTSKENSDKQILYFNMSDDAKTIDPHLNQATNGSTVIRSLFEGLVKYDESGKIIPATAESIPTPSADGLVYTFKIRSDAKWSDGVPVKAQDFEYAFKRGLDPKTASVYATNLYVLKNGQAYNEGKANRDDVGVKAVDDKTLEVTLESPTAYFIQFLPHSMFKPIREDIVSKSEGDAWTRDPKTCIGNGAFKMKEWKAKDELVVEKNENYYGAKDVKLSEVHFLMVTEASTALAAFQNKEIDYTENPPATEITKLKEQGVLKIFPALGTYYLDFNVSGKLNASNPDAAKALSNVKVRQALTLAINRQEIVDKVTMGDQKPALAFVPYGALDDKGNEFTTSGYFKDNDIETAKKLMEEAGYPDGKGFPTLKFAYNTSEAHKLVAEALQDMWHKNLGINIELENSEWAVFQQTRTDKAYELCRDGWFGDYPDANTMLDLLYSKNGNNNSGYNNPEYDKLIEAARLETDISKRIQELKDAEKLIFTDYPIAPLYYYTTPAIIQPHVKGLVKQPTGDIYFEYISIEDK